MRKPKETTRLTQRGLPHLSYNKQTPKINKLNYDGEIGKVTISDNETLKRKEKKEKRGDRGKGRN